MCGDDDRMATNFSTNPCLSRTEEAGGIHNVDGYPICVREGDGGDGGVTLYAPVSCCGYDCTNSCVKSNRTSWLLLSTRLYEYWVPVMMMVVRIRIYRTSCFLCAGYDNYVPLGWYGM